MKIEHKAPGTSPARTEEAARTAETATPTPRPAAGSPGSGDRFTLSADAQIVQSAIAQAGNQPDIRDTLVNRMRELLDRGELGNDASRLADAMIDRWLTTP